MDTRDVWAKPGTIWASRAVAGSHGRLRRHVWVEAICVPSGRLMMSGVVAGVMFETGVPGKRKCPVAPASAMAWSPAMLMLEALKRASVVGILLGVARFAR